MQRPLFYLYLSLLVFVQAVLGSRHISRLTTYHEIRADNSTNAAEVSLWWQHSRLVENIKSAMLASIRTRCVLSLRKVSVIVRYLYHCSWEQGTASQAVLETDNPEYSVFGKSPFQDHRNAPTSTLQLALSAVQTPDGRLSQQINDAEDAAALDGASAGSTVLLGSFTRNPRGSQYWESAADKELAYVLSVNRTSNGAISQRADGRQYWADGVFMGPPFLAYYGALHNNQSLLQLAYDNCRLYREALLIDGPTGPLWAHIYDDDTKSWIDEGIWATGLGWASLGMIRVAVTIRKSAFTSNMTEQVNDLVAWTKEILDGAFLGLRTDNLMPDYITGGPSFADSSSSSALASVAYRGAKFFPETFGCNYTRKAAEIREAVICGVDSMGVLSPVVDPLSWNATGVLSTEGQAFALMMFAAWKDWLCL
ncbi:hypothetical protein PILCRDRAFT_512349 [Piloderma croceum F 1598]|uniref:Glycoside hydrolase family 105 protein n=1 Tax=Piloderma croceum (strain F 1598) TaxID=765440 RepID=A0A0C3FN43_PILCF|nr:hypothetical protein PILCRDRAFT_512349 [Piloderma croceum F 1598]